MLYFPLNIDKMEPLDKDSYTALATDLRPGSVKCAPILTPKNRVCGSFKNIVYTTLNISEL